MDAQVWRTWRTDPVVPRLQSVPGVGPVVAADVPSVCR